MKYLGSKNRIAKHILPIIERHNEECIYIEPFVGGANMIDKITKYSRKLGTDTNSDLIAMFNAVKEGWIPPTDVSEEEYKAIKTNPDNYTPQLRGFVSIGCSFGGKVWGGYARGEGRNYAAESSKNLVKQAKNIQDVYFEHVKDYTELSYGRATEQVIYCDPPYADTTGYKVDFDHERFWNWCRELRQNDNIHLYVSEHTAPDDFKCILEIPLTTNIHTGKETLNRVEKLFV